MAILLMFSFLFSNFVEKWYLPQGTISTAGRLCIGDTDRDNNFEIIFTTYGGSYTVYIYELHLPNNWVVDSFDYIDSPILWDIGDFDLDGLGDIVFQASAGPPNMLISIAEAPDSFSYPTQEVWRDTVDIGTIQPICVYDIDQDSLFEIVQTGGEAGNNYYIDFSIHEAISDNVYQIKYYYESPGVPTSTIAFGDFDNDNQGEFVIGTIDGQYSVFEAHGNDIYDSILVNHQLPTANIKDCFTVQDADGDSRLEFVLKGYGAAGGSVEMYIFEAVSNDTHTIIDSAVFYSATFDYWGGHSDAGDVDGDSIPEIVLEACQNVYVIKAGANDSFYVWETLPGHNTGSNVRVYDFDNNGLAEILISGNNETHIYEYDGSAVEEQTSTKPVNISFSCSPNVVGNAIRISLILPQQTQISLNMYNNLGQRVKSILDDIQFTGYYLQKIDLTALAVGVYFIQLATPHQTITQKIVKIE